jgi:hypothetical protein
MKPKNSDVSLNFFTTKSLKVNFSQLDLSSDSGLLLVRQAEEKVKICQGFVDCLNVLFSRFMNIFFINY